MKTMAPILASALLLLLLLLHPSSSSLQDDALVLLSLKAATGSPLPTWDPARLHSVCSSWRAVRCSGRRIVSLDLSHSNLSGNITTVRFSSLDRLTDLSLAGNFLFGEINVANMTSLRYLNISGNQFSGTMNGWDSSTLPELQVLDVYDNNFTMQLPMGFASMAKLRYLDIGGNFFYGTIPEIYGSFASLEFLSVAGNDLHGRIPASLGNLTTIKELVLGYFNSFSGGLPPELGKLISLLHLDISSCELDGEIPLELGGLTSLSTLFLHTNRLSGSIPPSLSNLTSLTALDLSNNALTGEVPSSLSQLLQLRLLNLFLNRLHGSLPEFIAHLPMLETLQLFMNNFTGVIPETLGNNGALQVIDLSSNKLTGTIPEGICYGSKLRVLILLKNFLFGGIPAELGRCSALVRVRLGQNYLNGSIPSSFLYLPQLNLVELQSNYLSGVLAENLQPCREPSQLSQLNLSDNLLSGHLPVSLSNLSSLQMLTLSNNRFDGPIPTTIEALRKLVKLDLSGNAISGVIPLQLMGCSELTYLDLSRNNLSGPIPPEISGIAMLNYLNLSKNHLNLSIPKSIGGMKSLTSADFSCNDLSGKLPNNGQFAYFNASSFAGNPLLCNLCYSTNTARSAHMVGKAPPGDWKIVLALALLICCLALVAAGAARARSKPNSSSSLSQWKLTAFCRVEFTAEDVVSCMKECNVIGRGGAGVVYVGRLANGEEIAVKRLMGGFGQHGYDNGFKAEVRTLGSIRHRNIVRLLAFCSNRETNVLVYEYMRNGSLGAALHGNGGNGRKVTVCAGSGEESRRVVGWERRYGIALEAARGLCYLHHDCSPMIVHRDVKSNNILLDSKLEAHVADFGLAKFLRDGGASECMSAIAGSYGYIAPEYAYTLKVDEKSDVYSYGVVLLELLTGRRPVGDFGEGVDIVHWAKATTGSRQEHVNRIIDSRLIEVPMEEAAHIFFIAMLCVQDESVQRPMMREVVQMLSEFPRHLGEDRSTPPSIPQRSHSMGKDGNNCYKIFN